MSGFQSTSYITQAPAVEGQRANTNPIAVLSSSAEGGWRAGASGLIVGRFAWASTTSGYEDLELNNTGTGVPLCFIPNVFGESMITTYLAESSLTIPAHMAAGNPIIEGDYWVKNTGAGAVTRGQKAYAKLADGTIIFDDTGQTNSGYIETGWYAASPAAAGELVVMTTRATS